MRGQAGEKGGEREEGEGEGGGKKKYGLLRRAPRNALSDAHDFPTTEKS